MTATLPLTDPHALLGLHGERVRLWRPGVERAEILLHGKPVEMTRVDEAGLFEVDVPPGTERQDYRVSTPSGWAEDPYAFLPTFGELDEYLFGRGLHYQLYDVLGAQLREHEGVVGTSFAVWAPNAQAVSLVGDFNDWEAGAYPMRRMGLSGIWELFIPELAEGARYKFAIQNSEGELVYKCDPMAFGSEVRPGNASVVRNLDRHLWQDEAWMVIRGARPAPLNIYEVHLGSWRRKDGEWHTYRELATQLADYCSEMGFTHVELLPVAEHPLDESWGYQVTGYYAVTSRYGTPQDFQFMVDHLHQRGIGVILDWVPGHFPSDEWALARFDGTGLYEHIDPRQGYHPHWNTYIFNFGRHEVANFLIANALFWCEKMHIDGLRVDAVASMLYRDYGREGEEWIANHEGGRENFEAIEFCKHLNAIVHDQHPGVLMIAEESTDFPGVTAPLEEGGLGFDYKWDLGWMHDTLNYLSTPFAERDAHHNKLTFSIMYAFNERYINSLSHDEVVHCKASLLKKMAGEGRERIAGLRLLLSYMVCQPGGHLLFMGGELAQEGEWDAVGELDWVHADAGLQRMVADLNHLYRAEPALWEHGQEGFEWVDHSDRENGILCYRRRSASSEIVVVHNFQNRPFPHPKIDPIFNSNAVVYGGTGVSDAIGPLSTVIYR